VWGAVKPPSVERRRPGGIDAPQIPDSPAAFLDSPKGRRSRAPRLKPEQP